MAQQNWAYSGTSGKQYVVGLYHGTESGHLMVYCDLRIILVEFSVLQSYTYSFFIEDELLDLKIERKGEAFQYGFHVNKEVDTPKNKARKVEEKRERRSLSAVLIVAGVVAMFLLGAWWYNKMHTSEDALARARYSAWQAPTKVFLQQGALRYAFVADGKKYESNVALPSQTLFPLESGDEFNVRYDFDKPYLNVVDFESPTPTQIARYRQRAAAQHKKLHPNLNKKEIECLLDLAFEQKGLAGYADFYFQNTSTTENSLHNQETYGRLTRDVPFQQAAKLCR